MAENVQALQSSPHIPFDFSRYLLIKNKRSLSTDDVTNYIFEGTPYRIGLLPGEDLPWSQVILKYPNRKLAIGYGICLRDIGQSNKTFLVDIVTHTLAFLAQLEKECNENLKNPSFVMIENYPQRIKLSKWKEVLSRFGEAEIQGPELTNDNKLCIVAKYETMTEALGVQIALHQHVVDGKEFCVKLYMGDKEKYLNSCCKKWYQSCRCIVNRCNNLHPLPVADKARDQTDDDKTFASRPLLCALCHYPEAHPLEDMPPDKIVFDYTYTPWEDDFPEFNEGVTTNEEEIGTVKEEEVVVTAEEEVVMTAKKEKEVVMTIEEEEEEEMVMVNEEVGTVKEEEVGIVKEEEVVVTAEEEVVMTAKKEVVMTVEEEEEEEMVMRVEKEKEVVVTTEKEKEVVVTVDEERVATKEEKEEIVSVKVEGMVMTKEEKGIVTVKEGEEDIVPTEEENEDVVTSKEEEIIVMLKEAEEDVGVVMSKEAEEVVIVEEDVDVVMSKEAEEVVIVEEDVVTVETEGVVTVEEEEKDRLTVKEEMDRVITKEEKEVLTVKEDEELSDYEAWVIVKQFDAPPIDDEKWELIDFRDFEENEMNEEIEIRKMINRK